jgi:Tfp pilus assembly protein PilV
MCGITCRPLADDDGISLVEVLVGIVILGIALAAFAGTIISALAAITSDEQVVRGNQAAADTVEEVRSLPWECIGFAPGDPGYVATPTSVEITADCSGPARTNRPPATDTMTVDGQDYQVTRSITWVDAAGVAGTRNHKRVDVTLDWTVRGNAYSTSTSSIRVPTTAEVPVNDTSVACTPGRITRLSITPTIVEIASSGQTNETISVVVDTCSASSTVRLNAVTVGDFPLSPINAERTSWRIVLAQGTPNFAPGTLDWVVTATPADSSTADTARQTMTFFRASELVPLDVTAITQGRSFCVDDNGPDRDRLRIAVPITITVQGMTASNQGTVTLGWTSVNDSRPATFVSSTTTSSTWTTTVPVGTRFTATSTTLSAIAIRAADNADATETLVSASPSFVRINQNTACP